MQAPAAPPPPAPLPNAGSFLDITPNREKNGITGDQLAAVAENQASALDMQASPADVGEVLESDAALDEQIKNQMLSA